MISVAIMAHRDRAQWIPHLTDRLDAPAEVVWDRHNDRWDTGRRSLLAYDPRASHHLVVQDDALVCRDLVAGLEEAVKVACHRPLGLYMGRIKPSAEVVTRKVARALRRNLPWVEMNGPWWGVGILLPTADIPDVVAFGDSRTDVANYDRKISRYYESVGVSCWYTVPSLVEHRHGEANPSLVPGRNGLNRRAVLFHGEEQSALDIDWTPTPAGVKAGGVRA